MPYLWTLELNIRPASAEPKKIRVCGGELEKANYMQVAGRWDFIDEQPKQPLGHVLCNELLSDFSKVRMSPVTEDIYGLDGTVYTLRYSAGLNSVDYCWWCDLPAAWSELQPIIDRLLAISEKPAI